MCNGQQRRQNCLKALCRKTFYKILYLVLSVRHTTPNYVRHSGAGPLAFAPSYRIVIAVKSNLLCAKVLMVRVTLRAHNHLLCIQSDEHEKHHREAQLGLAPALSKRQQFRRMSKS